MLKRNSLITVTNSINKSTRKIFLLRLGLFFGLQNIRNMNISQFVFSLLESTSFVRKFVFPRRLFNPLTFIQLTWTIWRAPTNANKWRMGFNSAFKVLNTKRRLLYLKIQFVPHSKLFSSRL